MYKLIVWGLSGILTGMATLIFMLSARAEALKHKWLVNLVALALVLVAVLLFLLSFQTIRAFFAGVIPGYY